MNTKAVKSFGLALMLAAGVLAVLLALGTFSPQKVAAQNVTDTSISINPTTANAGDATPITVGFQVSGGAITSGQEVKIGLPGFSVPGTIDPSSVSIRGGGGAGNPAKISVTKTTITLEVGDDSGGVPMFIAGTTSDPAQVYVTFTRAAGISAGTVAGQYKVSVNDVDDVQDFNIKPSVSVSHKAGSKSTELVVSGSSFPAGVVGIRVVDNDPGSGGFEGIAIKGGSFEYEIEIKVGEGANQFAFGDNNIWVDHDGTGAGADGADTTLNEDVQASALEFNLSATVETAETLILGGRGVAVTLSEGGVNPDGGPNEASAMIITEVTIGDVVVFGGAGVTVPVPVADADAAPSADPPTAAQTAGKVVINIDVGSDVATGADQALVVTGSIGGTAGQTLGSTTVEVTALELTLNPDSVVQGNTVSLTGRGFGDDEEIMELRITPNHEDLATYFKVVASAAKTPSISGGRYVFSFSVPDLPGGDATVELMQSDGKIGRGQLTIKTPTIEIDPASSRKGTEVLVTGTGFPGNDPAYIEYNGGSAGAANADGGGNWSHVIIVPDDAFGDENEVIAFRPAIGDAEIAGAANPNYKATRPAKKVLHAVPGATTVVDKTEGESGDTITVTGEAHTPYTPYAVSIGGVPVGSGTADPDGNFTAEVTIPVFRPGSFTTLIVATGTGTAAATALSESVKIASGPPAPETRDVDVVFADLIEAGVLGNVFRYNNADKSWQGYNPAAPDLSDLEEVNVFDSLWVEVSEDTEFQDQALTAGWNNVTVRR
jgi:hypothetical protein